MVTPKFTPLGDRLLIRPMAGEEVRASGIVIPDTAKEKPQEGEVLAVGPGRFVDGQRQPLDVKVGDVVMYTKYGGDEFTIDGQEYKVLSESDVLGVIEK